ncbi:MAG: hypothetical protein HQK50_01150 [Oligoflexia bacterium]|nr:hypothetical protein [Oligoflexia bacterium]
MKTIPFLLLFILILLTSLTAYANKNYLIKGNSKTQTRYINKLLSNCESLQQEDQATSLGLDELKQCLLNSKLFSSVTISKSKETNQLIIQVKERWSLIPLPLYKRDSDGKNSYGFYLVDSNFLGLGNTLVLGGAYSNANSNYMLYYNNRALFLTQWGLSIYSGRDKKNLYLKDRALTTIDAFKYIESSYFLTLSYNFSDRLSLSGRTGYSQNRFEKIEPFTPPTAFNSVCIGTSLTWKNEHYKFYFNKGLFSRFEVMQEIYRTDNIHKQNLLSLNLRYGLESYKRQALQLTLTSNYLTSGGKADALKYPSDKSHPGLRGIPEGAYFSHFVTDASLDYQIPIAFFSAGTWTLAPFADLAFINNDIYQRQELWNRSYGIGSYFYLTGIMLPGMGFIFGKNHTFNNSFFEFTIGLSI